MSHGEHLRELDYVIDSGQDSPYEENEVVVVSSSSPITDGGRHLCAQRVGCAASRGMQPVDAVALGQVPPRRDVERQERAEDGKGLVHRVCGCL